MKVVTIEFYDHVQNGKKPMVCYVHGALMDEDERRYLIYSWHPKKSKHATTQNIDCYSIVKDAVISVTHHS